MSISRCHVKIYNMLSGHGCEVAPGVPAWGLVLEFRRVRSWFYLPRICCRLKTSNSVILYQLFSNAHCDFVSPPHDVDA